MRKWTAEEQDFFFAIATQARGQGTKLLKFEKEQLIRLANYSLEHNQRFYTTIENLANKLTSMRYYERTPRSFVVINLFQRFETVWNDDLTEMYALVRVSEDYEYVLNKLESQFTQFELKQFTNIRSTYAKEMFKKLKQWRMVGKKEYPIDEFRTMLEIPKSYPNAEINRRVITPILDELTQYFKGLKVKTIKSNKRGNPIIAYEFTWKPEKVDKWINDKYENISDKEPYLKPKNWLDGSFTSL